MAYTRDKLVENVARERAEKRADMAAARVTEYEEIIDGKSVMVQVFQPRMAWGIWTNASARGNQ